VITLRATSSHLISLHDALPISMDADFSVRFSKNHRLGQHGVIVKSNNRVNDCNNGHTVELFINDDSQDIELGNEATERWHTTERSEEHTSELQSRENLVCRLLL